MRFSNGSWVVPQLVALALSLLGVVPDEPDGFVGVIVRVVSVVSVVNVVNVVSVRARYGRHHCNEDRNDCLLYFLHDELES